VHASLDLHGLTVDEARNRVAAYISRAILAGLDQVEIIHGIGTGRLKKAITADLKSISAVRRVTPHPGNPGVLIAYL
jgi:DNA mismatch repair protein MutS2